LRPRLHELAGVFAWSAVLRELRQEERSALPLHSLAVSQSSSIGAEALVPNPALKPLEFLVGEWRTTGTHPEVPGETLCGRTSFSWHEGGAFLIMRSEIEQPLFPSGVAIIGSDDVAGKFAMIYFDERGTSRILDIVAVGERTVTWRRDDPDFSQSLTITADDDGDRLISRGRMSRKGSDWVEDLSQVFRRS
jgi:hypothetical protein